MTLETQIRIGFALLGAAVGAAFDGVTWQWWASYAVAWFSLALIHYWHREAI